MNKRYYLKNEKGQMLEINDLINSVFNLTSDIGTSKTLTFSRVGHSFIKSKEELDQPKIAGTIIFIKSESENEENYNMYERFFKTSEEITFVNVRAESNGLVEFCADVDWGKLGRALKKGRIITCAVELFCKTAWYKQNSITYTIEEVQEEAFGFPIDFENMVFGAGSKSSNVIDNTGYYEAPLYIKIKGPVLNPKIEVLKDKNIINSVEIATELAQYEELEYCTRDDKLFIRKINVDGTYTNLFDSLDANNNNNFIKLPVGASTLQVSAETGIKYANITVYIQN